MTNEQIASLFAELSDLMELAGESPFKIRAYRNAAASFRKLEPNLDIMTDSEISGLPGVGKAITEKIRAALLTGSFPTLEKWRKTGYASFMPLLSRGLSARKIRNLIKILGIDSLDQLKPSMLNSETERSTELDSESRNVLRQVLNRHD
jgi:DNA polymerase (family 10)